MQINVKLFSINKFMQLIKMVNYYCKSAKERENVFLCCCLLSVLHKIKKSNKGRWLKELFFFLD